MTSNENAPSQAEGASKNTDSLIVADFAGLLAALGYTAAEFVSIGHKPVGGVFQTAVMPPAEAPGYVDQLLRSPNAADIYFGVNSIGGPKREGAGRGKKADVTRLATLPVDLDVKAGGCPDLDTARAITDDLSGLLGTRPSMLVRSGYGVHVYWVVDGG